MSSGGGQRKREPRIPVRIGARLKSERGWSDVTLRNVSSRGIMGLCREGPERGDYVEIRCGTYVIVARVAWAAGGAFGAASQHAIQVTELASGLEGRQPEGERRKLPRAVRGSPRRSAADIASASRQRGRLFEFISVAVVAASLAGVAGSAAYQALNAPLARASDTLSASRHQKLLGNGP